MSKPSLDVRAPNLYRRSWLVVPSSKICWPPQLLSTEIIYNCACSIRASRVAFGSGWERRRASRGFSHPSKAYNLLDWLLDCPIMFLLRRSSQDAERLPTLLAKWRMKRIFWSLVPHISLGDFYRGYRNMSNITSVVGEKFSRKSFSQSWTSYVQVWQVLWNKVNMIVRRRSETCLTNACRSDTSSRDTVSREYIGQRWRWEALW